MAKINMNPFPFLHDYCMNEDDNNNNNNYSHKRDSSCLVWLIIINCTDIFKVFSYKTIGLPLLPNVKGGQWDFCCSAQQGENIDILFPHWDYLTYPWSPSHLFKIRTVLWKEVFVQRLDWSCGWVLQGVEGIDELAEGHYHLKDKQWMRNTHTHMVGSTLYVLNTRIS